MFHCRLLIQAMIELNDYNSGRRPDSTPYKKALKELQNILNPVVIKEGLVPVLLEAGGLVPAGKSQVFCNEQRCRVTNIFIFCNLTGKEHP